MIVVKARLTKRSSLTAGRSSNFSHIAAEMIVQFFEPAGCGC